jgi:hypothetical protein
MAIVSKIHKNSFDDFCVDVVKKGHPSESVSFIYNMHGLNVIGNFTRISPSNLRTLARRFYEIADKSPSWWGK